MIVVDASVAFKWLKHRDETHRKQAMALLERHVLDQIRITVPDFLFLEIANALVTKTSTRAKTVQKDLHTLFDSDLEIYRISKEDIMKSAFLANRKKTSVYDMIYAVIAKKLKVTLVTADQKFLASTKFRHVKLLSDYQT